MLKWILQRKFFSVLSRKTLCKNTWHLNYHFHYKYTTAKLDLSLVYLTADGQSSSSSWYQVPLWGPCPDPFFSDRGNCLLFLPVRRSLWREDGSVTYSAITDWSGHWGSITIHYRLIWDTRLHMGSVKLDLSCLFTVKTLFYEAVLNICPHCLVSRQRPESCNSERKEAAIATQRCGKHVSVSRNKHSTIEELLEVVFSLWSVLRLCSKDLWGSPDTNMNWSTDRRP
jgi:hypothetical protein